MDLRLIYAIILTIMPVTELRVGLPLAITYAIENNIPISLIFILILLINLLVIFFIFHFLDNFVAVPLPGTGAWTGCLLSWLLGLDRKKSILSICIGVIIASILVLFGTLGFISLFS